MTGLAEGSPGTEMPYSISVPMMRRAVTGPPRERRRTVRAEPYGEPSRGRGMMKVQDAAAEQVALFDAGGRVVGVAPRGVVYREGLWHGGTGVLLRSGDGTRVYLHRRAPDKLIFPGVHDCWAGGVIGPGETPEVAAARELA